MQDCINAVSDFGNIRQAVCISTQKIMDACRDQDCMESVPVYLTAESQETLECATSVKARSAELLYAAVDVEPVNYQDGYYCVGIQYYYRIMADAVLCAVKPVTIYGLATFGKNVMLYGGEGSAKTFTSTGDTAVVQPTAVVEAVDPMILSADIQDLCHCPPHPPCGCGEAALPEAVAAAFDDDLVFSGMNRQLQVTMGQFSLVRLERETQLLIPSYDYCVPAKACQEGACGVPENPCEAFSRMSFPVSAFFPTAEDAAICGDTCGSTQENAGAAAAAGNGRPTCGCKRQ
jgi:hypothetical protein